ncbi:MAG: nucleotidyl transferase AbiEii/AbiGii toxin family protein [Amphiplicatus sp.]
MTATLNDKLFLKGGILMGLAYDSPRQTADVDLTTLFEAGPEIDAQLTELMNAAFPRAAAQLGYVDLIVKVHSVKRMPKRIFEDAEFPALKMKVAFAERGTKQEKALEEGRAPSVIDVDISFNEALRQIQILELTGGQELQAYSLIDLMAEKYRAMLQQKERNRNRRQDVYDLNRLIESEILDDGFRTQLLDAFVEKCRSRHIEPTPQSLDDPEVKARSGKEWETMKLEVGEIPEFEPCYARVSAFYRNLPWRAL